MSLHTQGFPGGSEGKEFRLKCRRPGLDHWWGRSPGEGHGNPLQYSCLENPMDRGALWATVRDVSKSRTRLKSRTLHTQAPTDSAQASSALSPGSKGRPHLRARELCGLCCWQHWRWCAIVFRDDWNDRGTYPSTSVTQTFSLKDSCLTMIPRSIPRPLSRFFSCSSLRLQKLAKEFLQLQALLTD